MSGEEKPLVSIGEIAGYLRVSKYLARKVLKDYNIPTFNIGRFIAVYPSRLKFILEGANSIPDDTK